MRMGQHSTPYRDGRIATDSTTVFPPSAFLEHHQVKTRGHVAVCVCDCICVYISFACVCVCSVPVCTKRLTRDGDTHMCTCVCVCVCVCETREDVAVTHPHCCVFYIFLFSIRKIFEQLMGVDSVAGDLEYTGVLKSHDKSGAKSYVCVCVRALCTCDAHLTACCPSVTVQTTRCAVHTCVGCVHTSFWTAQRSLSGHVQRCMLSRSRTSTRQKLPRSVHYDCVCV